MNPKKINKGETRVKGANRSEIIFFKSKSSLNNLGALLQEDEINLPTQDFLIGSFKCLFFHFTQLINLIICLLHFLGAFFGVLTSAADTWRQLSAPRVSSVAMAAAQQKLEKEGEDCSLLPLVHDIIKW